MAFGIVRMDDKQTIDALHGVVVSLQRQQGASSIQQRLRHVRMQFERPVVARQRIVDAAKGVQHDAAVGMRLSIVRTQRDRAIEALQSVAVAIELVQRIAAIVVRIGIIGLDRDRALKAFERVLIAAERHQHAAAVIVGLGKTALVLDCLLEGRQRLLVPLQGDERQRVARKNLRRLRPLLHGRGNEPKRGRRFAAGQLDRAEHLQRIDVVRPHRQHRGVELLGFRDPALAMCLHRLMQGARDVEGLALEKWQRRHCCLGLMQRRNRSNLYPIRCMRR